MTDKISQKRLYLENCILTSISNKPRDIKTNFQFYLNKGADAPKKKKELETNSISKRKQSIRPCTMGTLTRGIRKAKLIRAQGGCLGTESRRKT